MTRISEPHQEFVTEPSLVNPPLDGTDLRRLGPLLGAVAGVAKCVSHTNPRAVPGRRAEVRQCLLQNEVGVSEPSKLGDLTQVVTLTGHGLLAVPSSECLFQEKRMVLWPLGSRRSKAQRLVHIVCTRTVEVLE